MRRHLLGGFVLVLALSAVYATGPQLIAPETDRAAHRCADAVPGAVSSLEWRLWPIAGWECREAPGAPPVYLGWWV